MAALELRLQEQTLEEKVVGRGERRVFPGDSYALTVHEGAVRRVRLRGDLPAYAIARDGRQVAAVDGAGCREAARVAGRWLVEGLKVYCAYNT